jgi:hypothetical protein
VNTVNFSHFATATTSASFCYCYFRDRNRDRILGLEKDKDKDRYSTLPPLVPRALDQRPSVQNMRLVFSSARHGRSLSALYEMVAGRAPCVLLVRYKAPIDMICNECHRCYEEENKNEHHS